MTQTRTVTCARCGETTAGLSRPPLSGAVGQLVYDHTCQNCWDEWFEQSINVINHYSLNPALREHREQLYEVMREFLNLTGK
jgi:Fe-S cluster biosynthesis and repair protein YggX